MRLRQKSAVLLSLEEVHELEMIRLTERPSAIQNVPADHVSIVSRVYRTRR